MTEDVRRESFIVNLEINKCTCMKFQEDELPCRHAVAIIFQKGIDITNYCSWYYLNETLRQTYVPVVHPICTAHSFGIPDDVTNEIIRRPARKSKAGKPRATRYKSFHEKLKDIRCGVCKQPNHNRRTCKNMPLEDV